MQLQVRRQKFSQSKNSFIALWQRPLIPTLSGLIVGFGFFYKTDLFSTIAPSHVLKSHTSTLNSALTQHKLHFPHLHHFYASSSESISSLSHYHYLTLTCIHFFWLLEY
ncbi:hypothetical protein BDV36DRAFT_233997 [Aspergillus pseudocaelatus]|uniref:Uncharacterized protein n=1 Tax=Aspergillus pseudocaelatus TaxID=1825620 RepID=A0ABQ6WCK7_9EURO|nr:hypothetical protein BDV36DRAFT_233997 [Aspergillus pseudocaelatus]